MSGLIFAFEGYIYHSNLQTWHRFLRQKLSEVVADVANDYENVEKIKMKPAELSLNTIVGEKTTATNNGSDLWETEILENGLKIYTNKRTGTIRLG